jgi:hypothetical protein
MKVRIPFVINPAGRWYAGGGRNAEKEPDFGFLMDMADSGDTTGSDFLEGWIEVDLPVPASVTVEGTAILRRDGPAGQDRRG